MADGTKIEWTDATWNPVTGCSVVSAGCTNCYAMKLAGTRLRNHSSRAGLTVDTKAGPVWNGKLKLNEEWLLQPLRWSRPRTIFVCAHGDLFHEGVPDEWIDRVFAVMALAPQHRFQVLTKRAARMRAYFAADAERRTGIRAAYDCMGYSQVWLPEWPLPNVWLGVSTEDQRSADERVPHLLATPAARRFLSCEPLLGSIDVAWALEPRWPAIAAGFLERGHFAPPAEQLRALDWIIVGGESGREARPMHPRWVKSLRDQCATAHVPFFFKQWGEWAPVSEIDEAVIDTLYHPAPEHDPEATRRCKVDTCTLHADGLLFGSREWEKTIGGQRILAYQAGHDAMMMMAIGKGRAGRIVDGVVHSGMPATPGGAS